MSKTLRICGVIGSVFLLLVKCESSLYLDTYEDTVTELRTSTKDVVYRLPNNVVPIEYDIDLELFFDDTPNSRAYTYNGKVSIIIQAIVQNTNQIVLHSNVDNILSVTLMTSDGAPVSLNVQSPFILEPQYHFLRVNTAQNLLVGTKYLLVIEYTSTMNETPLTRGIWRGKYEDESGERIYVTTHFQPYNARQAFPCWDEPLFKAVFTLHITRPSRYRGVFSNTGHHSFQMLYDGRIKDSFYPTPRMSSYLLTFLVSESFEVIAEDAEHQPPIRIIARSNANGLGDHALKLTVGMTDYFDEYFGIPYSTLDPNLLNDHVASPDWASAGTENWGMVSYRELHLMINKSETIMSVEHYTATLVSHELAHKWFGNLITCFWWSNTWINEGFASYFGYMATHQVFPEYEMHEHFNSRYLQGSLSVDSGAGTVALNHEVNTPSQVTGHFGTISYSKGAAFLRMTANIITDGTFRKVCRKFLMDHEFEPTDQHDLYNSFVEAINEDNALNDYPDFNFTNYYYTWVNEPGYPILIVDINHSNGEIRLRQERFFLNPSVNPTTQIYPIPITYSTKSNPNFNQLKPAFILSGNSDIITKSSGEEWVIFNNLQHGHYRVTYDSRTWNLIATALKEEPNTINYMNRAQVVDDVFALMRSERVTYVNGFNILQFLRNETNYHVWNPAISGYTWLRNRLRHLPDNQAKLDGMILDYLEHVINVLGFDVDGVTETPTVTLTRQEVLHFACTLGHVSCVSESQSRFRDLRENNNWVDPRLRRNVYVVGIREGGTVEYRFLAERMSGSNIANDRLEMLRALAATKNANLLNEYLEMMLTDVVRPHDKVNAFNYALLGNQESAHLVLQFVKNKIDDIRIAFIAEAPNNPVHSALSSLASYLDSAGLDEMETWLTQTQVNSAEYASTLGAISSARSNIEWGNTHVDEIMAAVRGGAVQLAISAMLFITLSFLPLLL